SSDVCSSDLVGISGDDGTDFVAHRRVVRRGGGEEGVEEIGVPVAHESEDLGDVLGQGVGDMCRGVSHAGPFANEIWKKRSIYVSLAGDRGFAPLFRAPAKRHQPDLSSMPA